jgi:hypothetical protein
MAIKRINFLWQQQRHAGIKGRWEIGVKTPWVQRQGWAHFLHLPAPPKNINFIVYSCIDFRARGQVKGFKLRAGMN